MRWILPFFFLFLLIHCGSCSFNNQEDYFADIVRDSIPEVCNTKGLTYDSLTYIFSNICANCHNNQFTYRGGIELDIYKSVKNSINTGKVLPAIKHQGKYKMPYQLPKLSDCDIERIETWINNGMPEK